MKKLSCLSVCRIRKMRYMSCKPRFILHNIERPTTSQIMSAKTDKIIQPYLFFSGNCEQAVEFYKKAVGAEVQLSMRYKESPEPPPPGMVPPGFENKIMHTSFRIGETLVMAADDCTGK